MTTGPDEIEGKNTARLAKFLLAKNRQTMSVNFKDFLVLWDTALT